MMASWISVRTMFWELRVQVAHDLMATNALATQPGERESIALTQIIDSAFGLLPATCL